MFGDVLCWYGLEIYMIKFDIYYKALEHLTDWWPLLCQERTCMDGNRAQPTFLRLQLRRTHPWQLLARSTPRTELPRKELAHRNVWRSRSCSAPPWVCASRSSIFEQISSATFCFCKAKWKSHMVVYVPDQSLAVTSITCCFLYPLTVCPLQFPSIISAQTQPDCIFTINVHCWDALSFQGHVTGQSS